MILHGRVFLTKNHGSLTMIRKNANGVEWLEFEIFANEPGLVHGVFLRHGGVSEGPYGSLNAGGRTADRAENVQENHRRILQSLNLPRFAACRQVHGNGVVVLGDETQKLDEHDGMITQRTDLALMILHADCQAAIFYDPVHKVLANVHSGWRGNVKNIYRATVEKMREVFGSRPQDLLVGVSPSLGPRHSEFINYQTEFPEEFWRFQFSPNYFDLWKVARAQLEECGILPHHIQIAEICTFSNPQDYFSYRRDKVIGHHATLAGLV